MTDLSPSVVGEALAEHGYLADAGLATVVFLALHMRRPLLLEGDAGVGKTEVAKALARWTGGELLRLQCFEGIDAAQALYEWDHARQLLHLRASGATSEEGLYDERFLTRRPVLRALAGGVDGGPRPVLLIDEVDRADDEFEALLLEVLSDWSVTVPELGTITAAVPPVVVVTSNRTRDVHDALKRRCLYHWIEHPSFDREVAVIRLRVPEADAVLAREVAAATAQLRDLGLYKPPGVAEAIDWATALAALGRRSLDAASVDATLGAVLKYREDAERTRAFGIDALVTALRSRSADGG
ncbi:MAG TPA: MoxR family ATPase [Iamia sp.]|nr:MoxR family ATPase [Iamia sp.]